MQYTTRLPGGFRTEPGFLYIATREDSPARCKVGKSRHPWRRLASAKTWETDHRWSLNYVFAAADMSQAEEDVHQCLTLVRIPHVDAQEDSEHFAISATEAHAIAAWAVGRQKEAFFAQTDAHRRALGTGSTADAMNSLWLSPCGEFDVKTQVRLALDGKGRAKETLAARGLHAVPRAQVMLFNRAQPAPLTATSCVAPQNGAPVFLNPFEDTDFAPYYREVFAPFAGINRKGQLLRWTDVSQDLLTLARRLTPEAPAPEPLALAA